MHVLQLHPPYVSGSSFRGMHKVCNSRMCSFDTQVTMQDSACKSQARRDLGAFLRSQQYHVRVNGRRVLLRPGCVIRTSSALANNLGTCLFVLILDHLAACMILLERRTGTLRLERMVRQPGTDGSSTRTGRTCSHDWIILPGPLITVRHFSDNRSCVTVLSTLQCDHVGQRSSDQVRGQAGLWFQ
jgi:hypothetical protein